MNTHERIKLEESKQAPYHLDTPLCDLRQTDFRLVGFDDLLADADISYNAMIYRIGPTATLREAIAWVVNHIAAVEATKQQVRIHELIDGTTRVVSSEEECRDSTELTAYQACIQLRDTITIGKTIAEPVWE